MGSKGGKETSTASEGDSAVPPALAQTPPTRATSTRQAHPVSDGGVAVAQRTRKQLGASGSKGGVVRIQAVFTTDSEKDDIVMISMSRKWVAEGAAGMFLAGEVENMILQQAGAYLPPPEV